MKKLIFSIIIISLSACGTTTPHKQTIKNTAEQNGDVCAVDMGGEISVLGIVDYLTSDEISKACRQSAHTGNPIGQLVVGLLYYTGRGGYQQSHSHAFNWFTKAAYGEERFSKVLLAVMYKYGIYVTKDLRKSEKWMADAAYQGSPLAQYELSRAYISEDYGILDPIRSYAWIFLALQQSPESKIIQKNYNIIEKMISETGLLPVSEAFINSIENGTYRSLLDEQADENASALQHGIRTLKDNAAGGDTYAQVGLAILYENGLFIPKNTKYAAQWYSAAAGNGNVFAQYRAAKMHLKGDGVKQDSAEGRRLMQLAANGGVAGAQFFVGKLHLIGILKSTEHDNECSWFNAAFEQDYKPAEGYVGLCLLKGQYVERNVQQGHKLVNAALEQKDPEFQFDVARFYLDDKFTSPNVAKATALLKECARNNTDLCRLVLGKMYVYGEFIPQDVARGIGYLSDCAERGTTLCLNELGAMYLFGENVAADHERGLRLLNQSARQGNVQAQLDIATAYLQGVRVPNYSGVKALKAIRSAANDANSRAEYLLGWLYYHGQLVYEDRTEAKKWMQIAANHGSNSARDFIKDKGL